MGKSWIRFTLLMAALVFAPTSNAQRTMTLTKLYQARIGPSSKIASFVLGSEKPYLAVVFRTGGQGAWTLWVWNSATDRPVFTETFPGYVPGEPAPVVRFSPDDAWLAVGAQTNVLLLDVSNWKVAGKLARPTNLSPVVRVSGLEFSADSKLLLARYVVPVAPHEPQPIVPFDLGSKEALRIHILSGPMDYMAVGESASEGPWFATVEHYNGKYPQFVLRHLAPQPQEFTRWFLISPENPLPPGSKAKRPPHFCQGPGECTQIVGVSASAGKIRSAFLDSKGHSLGLWEARKAAFEGFLAETSSGRIHAAVAMRSPRAAAVLPGNRGSALVVWDLDSRKELYRDVLAASSTPWQALVLSAEGQYLAAQEGSDSVAVYAIKP